MWETFKKNPLIVIMVITAIVFIIWAIITGLNSNDVKIWFYEPLSKLTKGDIIIFILAFGIWTRNSK